MAGELTTTNYSWVKPTVGSSTDAWGGYLNTDLDGIDSTVKSVSNVANAAYPASNPSGYQTAAQVTTSLAPYAPLISPVFTGTPSLPTGTTGVTQTVGTNNTTLATTAFVGALPVAMNDNRIINGDMRIDQRNNGASGTANASVYTVDRWIYQGSQASKGTWQRQGPAAAGSAFASIGFAYSLSFVTSSAYAAITTDTFNFQQRIEADMVSDFAWGTSNAQPVTLSFWAISNQTGAFSGSLRNDVPNRSYPFAFSLSTANTWTKIVINIPGDAAGTWNMSGNANALNVAFDLGSGANFRTAAGAWVAGSFTGVTGAVSIVATNGANFYMTGVKLEIGSVATPYNRQSLAKSMADCQRYYQIMGSTILGSYSLAGGLIYTTLTYSAPMRAAPTAVLSGQAYNNASALTAQGMQLGNLQLVATTTATGAMWAQGNVALSAEL